MAFDLRAIAILGAASLPYAGLLPARARGWALLVGSVVAIYWLQTALSIRYSDFILPTLTLGLIVAAWWLVRLPDRPEQQATAREDRLVVVLMAALVIGLSCLRFVEADVRLTASRPPDPLIVALALVAVGAIFAALARLLQRIPQRTALTIGILVVVGLFVALKTPALSTEIARGWRSLTRQDASLASPVDWGWVGFSYVAFRLIHTLRDRQTGILPVLSLREYVTYAIFFPAYLAGPIDRAERFAPDYRALPALKGLDATRYGSGLTRIGIGLFKKFVIADLLAQGLSLTAANAEQVTSTAGLWTLLYGYTFRLYFDFSGYTDIAIGLGVLFGITLPENFNRPYLKTSITAFWQSWHMTLSTWARFYVFTPFSRWMLTRARRPSPMLSVLGAQLATMITIGLWHGVTWNFVIWGAWHAAGLFAHKQWSDRTRRWYRDLQGRAARRRAWALCSWFVTLQFVVIGWIWFVVPDPAQAVRLIGGLFGVGW